MIARWPDREKGGVLIHVLVTLLVLFLFVPAMLMMALTQQLHETRDEHQRRAVLLAASGMESFLALSGSLEEKIDWLKDRYGLTQIPLPEGGTVDYRQYLVPFGTPDGQEGDLAHMIPVSAVSPNGSYKAVFAAVAGDPNHNQVKEDGEPFYFLKTLVVPMEQGGSGTDFLTYQFPQETGPARIDPVYGTIEIEVAEGTDLRSLVAVFTLSEGARAYVGSIEQISGVTPNDFSNSLIQPFRYNVVAGDGTSRYWVGAVRFVSGPGSDGIVWFEDENGERTPREFSNIIDTGGPKLIITEGIGTYFTPTTLDFNAPSGIVIEPGVSLSTTSRGNTSVTLNSSKGDIVMDGVELVSTGNSVFSDVTVQAAGNISMENASITAERSITISAGGNIYLTGATLASLKKADITLESTGGIIYVDGLSLNKDAIAIPKGVKICGRLAPGSTINGLNFHSGVYCQ